VSGARVVCAMLGVLLAVWLALSGLADAAVIYSYEAQPRPAWNARRTVTKRASNGPPLSSTPSSGSEENAAGVPSGKGDPLVENGLSSPLCKSSISAGLSSAALSNCKTSGFVGTAAPTGNYAIDVNIDVGPFGLSKGGLLSVIQDVFVAPLWNALVWVAHALVVMLEWCYTLELLKGSTMSSVARSLREAQASFTQPWLVLVLATASVLVLYNGLIRRRVAETLGQALTTIAMMAAGLLVIADPLGTVGAVGQWANQASLGTLGTVANGTPAHAPATLADSMRAIFAGAIEMPWCYLEFGNVRWCSDPTQLDPRLRKTALSLLAAQQTKLGCRPSFDRGSCAATGRTSAIAVARGDELLREADTNGKLFLAFPANEAQRNSVKNAGSLLHVLCQSEDDTKCNGPTAAQAEFRSDSGTFPRMIGVALIASGVLGMALLFGMIALHLLAAAVISLFMLLLAPFAVLAPALGDGGRAVFGGWLTRLLGAVTSKLLFSFLLGAVLTMQRILMSLQSLGWWTEWLLISAFWWSVFLRRHHALALLQNRTRERVLTNRAPDAWRVGRRSEPSRARGRPSISRSPKAAHERRLAISHPVRWATNKLLAPVPVTEKLRKRGHTSHDTASRRVAKHVRRTPRRSPAAGARVSRNPDMQPRLLAKRAQLERVRDAREAAHAGGDRRRAAKLAVRERRIAAELAHDRERLEGAHFDEPRERKRAGSPQKRFVSVPPSLSGPRHSPGAPGGRPSVERPSVGRLPVERPSVGRSSEGVPPRGMPPGVGDASPDARAQKSRIMDDARAVAEGRKRQLGYGPKP
jgi:hypothetical protein